MAGIGESIAAAVLESLVLNLGKMVAEAARSLSGVRNEIQSMKIELDGLRVLLIGGQQKLESVGEAQIWLKQVRSLVYDIEDCIEDSVLYLGQLDDKDRRTGCLRRAIRQMRKVRVCRRISTEIKALKTRVQGVRESGKLCLEMAAVPLPGSVVATTRGRAHTQDASRLAAPFVDDGDVVGIDNSRDELIQWLLAEDEPQLRVISVVGMGGLGKTTLVRKVYESPTVSDIGRFPHRAWITVSQTPDFNNLLKSMIEQLLSPAVPQVTGLDRCLEILRSHLKEMRYVVILDDVWDVAHWKIFQHALPSNTLGSRIIVTTRIQNVAATCCVHDHGRVYQPKPLDDDQSWNLFCKRTFGSADNGPPPYLEDIAKAITKSCGGLPLAIATIGGLLSVEPNRSRRAWQGLLTRLRDKPANDPTYDTMTQILNLSYEDLPSHLKPCFLYLSLFPEDCSIGRKRLVRLWMAQEFVTTSSLLPDETPEEVAEVYFNELINRNLIQPSRLRINGQVRSCRVHDVVREAIITKSKVEMLISVRGVEEDTRHLAVHGHGHGAISPDCNPDDTRLARIRSLILSLSGDSPLFSISPSMRLLRVLDLQGCRYVEDGHLETICKLSLLKYLNLRKTSVEELPESLGKLRNLETLDVRDNAVELPATVVKLQKLRHLLSTNYGAISSSAHGTFPTATGMGLPRGVGNLKSLLTLSYVGAYGCSEGTIRELGELTELRKLCIVLEKQESGMELCDALDKLSVSLRSLTVWTEPEFQGFSFMDSLSSPPLHLTSLKLGGHLEVLPCWVASLANVTKIALYGSEIKEDALQVLQALPSLIELRLYSSAEMNMSFRARGDGFPSLKFLCLKAFGCVQSVRFEQGEMPNLEKLCLWRCNLREGALGIEHLARLKEIVIDDKIDDEQWAVLERAAESHPNHPRLTIDDTEDRSQHKIYI